MIVEFKTYTSDTAIIVVEEIVAVEFLSQRNSDKSNGLDDQQYRIKIKLKDRENFDFWFNGEKAKAETEFNKLKDALKSIHSTNDIKSEIEAYFSKIKNS